jgi:hypothetical protein
VRTIYRLFGLTVSSELSLPLPTTEGNAEVQVLLGRVDTDGALLRRTGPPVPFSCFRTGETIVLDWPGARFAVTADRVVVDLEDLASAIDLFLNPVWSVVLAAHGYEPLHACVVARDGVAVSIHGISGSGKTTSGLALLDRGWQLVTDDLLVLDDQRRAIPGPPFIRLLPDRAAGRPGEVDAAGKLRYYPALVDKPVPLSAMVVLSDDYHAFGRLTGASAVHAILAQVYNPVLTHPDQTRRRFDLALDLVDRTRIYGALPRSLSAEQLEQIVDERTS